MAFVELDKLPRMELFPGVRSRLVAGKNLMLSALELDDGGIVPEHSHPHEQAGLMLEGKLKLRIGNEEKLLTPGDVFVIPGNVVHSGVVTEGPARVLDIFSPVREDYLEQYNRYAQTSQQTVWE